VVSKFKIIWRGYKRIYKYYIDKIYDIKKYMDLYNGSIYDININILLFKKIQQTDIYNMLFNII